MTARVAILTPDPAEGDNASLWPKVLARLQGALQVAGIEAVPTPWTAHVDDAAGLRDFDRVLPLLAWVWQQQPDLLLNPDNNRKVEFDAEIVNDDVADILFKVPVWERVMVTSESGTPKAEHLAESRPRLNGGEWEMVFDQESGGSLA